MDESNDTRELNLNEFFNLLSASTTPEEFELHCTARGFDAGNVIWCMCRSVFAINRPREEVDLLFGERYNTNSDLLNLIFSTEAAKHFPDNGFNGWELGKRFQMPRSYQMVSEILASHAILKLDRLHALYGQQKE